MILTFAATVPSGVRPYTNRGKPNLEADEAFELRVEIPASTTATVTLPASSARDVAKSAEPLGSEKGIEKLEKDVQHVTLELSSGSYMFRVRQLKSVDVQDSQSM